eukprot:COSAG02_NODE_8815_length_2434_cov_2.682227_1_plen_105_part_00
MEIVQDVAVKLIRAGHEVSELDCKCQPAVALLAKQFLWFQEIAAPESVRGGNVVGESQVRTHRHHFDMHRMPGLKLLPGEPHGQHSATQHGPFWHPVATSENTA